MTQETRKQETPLALGRLVSLAEIMRQMLPSSLVHLGSLLERVIVAGGSDENPVGDDVGVAAREEMSRQAVALREQGLRGSAASLERLVLLWSDPTTPYGEVRAECRYYQQAIQDDLDGGYHLSIAPGREIYMVETDLFGELVAENFPSAAFDIAEASRCLALARGTACVFHLMRVMELVLRGLMKDMGEPYNEAVHTDWSKMLAKCNQHASGASGPKQKFYRDAVTHLSSVKWSWRNPTMHPSDKYTEEEAEAVWNSVRAFVRHVATELNEPPRV